MVNTAKLRGLIVEKGLTNKAVAEAIGVSERTFSRKLSKGCFGTDDAERMVELLKIENPAEIFLCRG